MGSEVRESAGLVLAHKAAITGDIGGEDSRKPALYPLPTQYALPAPARGVPQFRSLAFSSQEMTNSGHDRDALPQVFP